MFTRLKPKWPRRRILNGWLRRTPPTLNFCDGKQPDRRALGTKEETNFLADATAEPLFQFEPCAQQPVPRKPRKGGRCGDPLVVEFEVRLEFSDLQRLAEFSSEDGFHAHGVARLDKYREGLDRQQISNVGDLLRQPDLVSSADLNHMIQQLGVFQHLAQ